MPDQNFAAIPDASPSFRRITDFALRLAPEEIPESARKRAAELMLDTLGICAAAAPMQAGVIARETAVALYGSADGSHAARILFDGRNASTAGAAFATASQTDNLDGHDGFNPTKGHIGVAVVPALAALAEALPDLSGAEALAALVVGYEIAGRAGLALHATVADYHTSGAWNTLGVTAMAARLMGLGDEALREAIGIAEYHGPRSQMMREIANPSMLHDGSGQGTLVGLSAAVMAAKGFTGAPAITAEDEAVAPFWADLGQHWQVEDQYIKPYPICRWAHAPIDAMRALRLEHGFTGDQIERITIRSFSNAIALYPGMPGSTSQAQYSLPFAVAAMAVNGHIGLEQISGEGLSHPLVADLVSRTDLEFEQRHEERFPSGRWADISVRLKDGRSLASGDHNARGGIEEPFGEAEISEKFLAFAAPVLGQARAEAIVAACLGLARPGARFADLAAHLYDAP